MQGWRRQAVRALRCRIEVAHGAWEKLVLSQPRPEHLLLHGELGVLPFFSLLMGGKHLPFVGFSIYF